MVIHIARISKRQAVVTGHHTVGGQVYEYLGLKTTRAGQGQGVDGIGVGESKNEGIGQALC